MPDNINSIIFKCRNVYMNAHLLAILSGGSPLLFIKIEINANIHTDKPTELQTTLDTHKKFG